MSKRKKKKARKGHGTLYYLNPMHLVTEVQGYGFHYSIKKMLKGYLLAAVMGVAAGAMYKLNIVQAAIVCIAVLFAAPFLIANSFRMKYQQNRFAEVNKYIEKMLYYFKSSRKILTALQDLRKIFPKGEMAEVLDEAIEHIQFGSSADDVTEEALAMIEKKFVCGRLKTLHGFLLSVERNGGNCDTSIEMLLADRNLWADRVIDTQKRKGMVKTNIMVSMVLSIVLCLSIIYLPDLIAANLDIPSIASYGVVSWSAVIFIILLLVLYVKGDGKLCVDWLDEDDVWDDAKAEKEYKKVVNYNPVLEFKESILWAAGAFIIALAVFLFTKNMVAVVAGAGVVTFMLNQHTIGHNLAKKNVSRAIEKAFPAWLMSVSLLMQTENVRVAIRESYQTAPSILKPALEEFLAELDEDPDSEKPYNEFLTYFNMPEITDAMSTLYSLSSGAGGNADNEFRNIINRILKMMDRAELIKNDDKIAVMGLYVTAPSLIGAIKLLIDMTALLFAFFEMAG